MVSAQDSTGERKNEDSHCFSLTNFAVKRFMDE